MDETLQQQTERQASESALGAFGSAEASQPEEKPGVRHIVFGLGTMRYAVPASSILELDRMPPLTPIPNMPPFVLGLVNLRGDIVSVLDMRRLFGLQPTAETSGQRMLKLRHSRESWSSGFLVDSVHGIRLIPDDELEEMSQPPPPGGWAIGGIHRRGSDVLNVMDVDKLFDSTAIAALRRV